MPSAVAPNFDAAEAVDPYVFDPHGAQSLLTPGRLPSNYPAQIGAAAVYALILGAIVTLSFKTAEVPVEEQQVIELAPIPEEEPPPPEDTPPPMEEQALPDPPPPPMMDPIAPVEEVKPPPKPVEKPIPKVEKKVEAPRPRMEAKPRPETRPAPAAPRADVPGVRAPAAPPGATPSAIANTFHACMQRAASSFEAPLPGRVSYHATFSATGSLTSYSISPSGKGPLDSIASRLGGRCGSVPAPGKPVSLSGVISFSP
jgi:outer membrane biosynthesis protein TonB